LDCLGTTDITQLRYREVAKQTGHDLMMKRPRRPRAVGFGLIRYKIFALLAILGPGFITANVDNDPGGILTYSQAGAKYGYALLWTLVPKSIGGTAPPCWIRIVNY